MKDTSLLQRIQTGPAQDNPNDMPTTVALIASALNRLLNTRQGNVLMAPDYGAPDLNDLMHDTTAFLTLLEQGIAQAIKRFEPRLQKVLVTAATNPVMPDRINVVITAEIRYKKQPQTVIYHTVMMQHGRILVRQ